MEPSEDRDPSAAAVEMTRFFAERVPGQLGCVFDHAASDLVVGHIDVTENLIAGTGFLFAPAVVTNESTGRNMALFRCTQMVLLR